LPRVTATGPGATSLASRTELESGPLPNWVIVIPVNELFWMLALRTPLTFVVAVSVTTRLPRLLTPDPVTPTLKVRLGAVAATVTLPTVGEPGLLRLTMSKLLVPGSWTTIAETGLLVFHGAAFELMVLPGMSPTPGLRVVVPGLTVTEPSVFSVITKLSLK